MTNALLFLGLILTFVGVIALLDWYGRRRDARSQRGSHP
jgi:hypothetical protein